MVKAPDSKMFETTTAAGRSQTALGKRKTKLITKDGPPSLLAPTDPHRLFEKFTNDY